MHRVLKYKLDHAAFWMITVLFYGFTRRNLIADAGSGLFLLDVIVRNVLIASACYLNIYLLFEKLFRKGRYVTYILSLLLLLLAYTMLQSAFDGWLQLNAQTATARGDFMANSYYNFSIGIFYITFTLALQLSKKWYQQQIYLHKLQAERSEAELRYLKAQLNPHFLFNCINTIYFQIDPLNVEARDSLQKFAEMLRYQLYECNEDTIPIEKETSYLESYVDLQRLRKDSHYRIDFNVEGSVCEFHIAPLLLLPFVENAFKHLSSDPRVNHFVELNMRRTNGSFYFHVANSTDANNNDPNRTGIGLSNVQRRLDLLYENRYSLDIHQTGSMYSVDLKLDIK